MNIPVIPSTVDPTIRTAIQELVNQVRALTAKVAALEAAAVKKP
jgi:hypothetical protein